MESFQTTTSSLCAQVQPTIRSSRIASGETFRKYQHARESNSKPRNPSCGTAEIRSIDSGPLFQLISALREIVASGNLEIWEGVAIEHQVECLLRYGKKAATNPAFIQLLVSRADRLSRELCQLDSEIYAVSAAR